MNIPEFDIDIQVTDDGPVFVVMSDTLMEMPPVWRWVCHMLNQEVRYWILRNLDAAIAQARYRVSYLLLVLMEDQFLWENPEGRWGFWEKEFPTLMDVMMRESREMFIFLNRIEDRIREATSNR